VILSFILSAAVAAAEPTDDPCKGTDTISMAKCMDGKIEQATAQLRVYRTRAINRFKDANDPATAKAIEDADIAFDGYRQTYCDAVYQQWIGGTIRFAMHQSCNLRLVDEETHRVWRDFLTYFDSTPPLLPEPKPTK
jgi:uncharacterized protein YecT (DUF1311 family)